MELTARCALRSDNHGESDHEACARRRPCHPATAPPQAQPDGGGQLNSQTAKQPHGPLLRLAQSAHRAGLAPGRCGPSEATARMDVRLRVPFRMRRGAQRPADQGSRLSERSAAQRVRARPRWTRAPQVARSEAQGRRQWGRLFFAYFLLAKQKKVSRLPGRQPGLRPQPRHAARSAHGFDKLSPNGLGCARASKTSSRTLSRETQGL